jgi:hypothetical protein
MNWADLPEDLHAVVLCHLSPRHVLDFGLVDRKSHELSISNDVWDLLLKRDFPNIATAEADERSESALEVYRGASSMQKIVIGNWAIYPDRKQGIFVVNSMSPGGVFLVLARPHPSPRVQIVTCSAQCEVDGGQTVYKCERPFLPAEAQELIRNMDSDEVAGSEDVLRVSLSGSEMTPIRMWSYEFSVDPMDSSQFQIGHPEWSFVFTLWGDSNGWLMIHALKPGRTPEAATERGNSSTLYSHGDPEGAMRSIL